MLPSSFDTKSRRSTFLAAFAVFSASCLGACFEPVPEGPPSGYERDVYACRNRFDDDGDRLVDCRDPDCIRQGFCNRRIPLRSELEPENTVERCSDFVDNDDDGRFDCGDPDCTIILELCCSLEFDDVTCSNGVDDDRNGFADCQDSGCSRNPFVTVCELETDCANNVDDDGDRRPDCFDSDCERSAHCIPGGEDLCNNGVDEEGDGRADCNDRDCYADPVCLGPEASLVRCIDGNDNDGSMTADCNDPTCLALTGEDLEILNAYCANLAGPETSLERCSDGVDNDGNTYTDCADFSCSREDRGASPEAAARCAMINETSAANCTDGLDNDENGYTDCADRNCCMSGQFMSGRCVGNAYIDPAVTTYCLGATETSPATCIDGLDNDLNGYVDCSDRNCCLPGAFMSTCPAGMFLDETVNTYCSMRPQESTLIQCTDGLDNDGNSFIDCADYGCSRSLDAEVARHCATDGERSFTLCTDNLDNDQNGFPDCQDFSCRAVVEEIVAPSPSGPVPTGRQRSPCQESVGANAEFQRVNCMDGRDNDLDGFSDCDDWDCNWNPNTRDLCFYSAEVSRPRICG